MKKFIGYGLVAVLAAAVLGTTALIAKPNIANLMRADGGYNGNSLFYARASVDGEVKYLTYSGGKTMTVTENLEEALFDIDFQTATTATLKCGEHYLGYNGSGADLKETDTLWTINNGLFTVTDSSNEKTRTLSYRSNTYDAAGNVAKAYVNVDYDEYYAVFFYTPEQFNERNTVCNWSIERQNALLNLSYNIPELIEKYTITYNANGGTGTMFNDVVTSNHQYPLRNCEFVAPQGKQFGCWYYNEEEITGSITVTSDMTIYAHWIDLVSISSPLTITANDFVTTGYAANNRDHYLPSNPIHWTSNQVMKNGDNIQWQKSKGYIYNTTNLGTIISITINSSAGTFTTYYGNTENPTSGTTPGTNKGYFRIQVGSATGTVSSIVITFE